MTVFRLDDTFSGHTFPQCLVELTENVPPPKCYQPAHATSVTSCELCMNVCHKELLTVVVGYEQVTSAWLVAQDGPAVAMSVSYFSSAEHCLVV